MGRHQIRFPGPGGRTPHIHAGHSSFGANDHRNAADRIEVCVMTDQYSIDVRQSVRFPNFSQKLLLEVKRHMRLVESNPDKPVVAKRKSRFIGELNIED